jgi:hypothetical protein
MEDIIKKKNALLNIIDKYYDNYNINNHNIISLIPLHKNYIYLMENLKMCIIYKWTELKQEYKNIKSQINKNDKLYFDIISLYSDIIIYFDSSESKIIEKHISDIHTKKNDNIIILRELSIIHKDTLLKHHQLINNKKTLTITIYSPELNDILDELLLNVKKLSKTRNEIVKLVKMLF